MNRIGFGVVFGIAAGVIDVIPMALQKLPLAADISAFVMWVASGFLIATSSLKLPGILKGLVIAYLMMLPCLVLVVAQDAATAVPILAMTTILGALLGFFVDRIGR